MYHAHFSKILRNKILAEISYFAIGMENSAIF